MNHAREPALEQGPTFKKHTWGEAALQFYITHEQIESTIPAFVFTRENGDAAESQADGDRRKRSEWMPQRSTRRNRFLAQLL